MKLSMEIPTAHLADLSPLVDIDFLIPHKLEDKRYRDFYAARPNVECIMDNGFHELGKPIDLIALLTYYDMMQPDFLISPDRLDDVSWTMDQARDIVKRVPAHKLAGNVFGETHEERMSLINFYANLRFGMVCFPYRKRKIEWFTHNAAELALKADEFGKIHFLGAIDETETKFLASTFRRASIDTAKPIKWGLQKRRLDTVDPWSGGWVEYDSFSEARIGGPVSAQNIFYNIAYLRKLLA